MNDSNPPKKTGEEMDKNKEAIKEENIGEVRHDEPVTAKGIARALLMADEPEQRLKVVHPGNEKEPKSDD